MSFVPMIDYEDPGIGPLNDVWTVRQTVREFVGDGERSTVGDRSFVSELSLAGTVA
jgi:hypothetical protein